VIVLSVDDLRHIGDTAMGMGSIAVPHLVLVPTADRKVLDRISEICKCRVQNALIRESVLQAELRTLLPSPSDAKPAAANARSASALMHDADELRPVILVADDNAINRKLLATLLRQNHYRVLEAGDGEELIRLAAGEHWDAALVDIHMPDMDGMEATQKLLAMSPGAHPPIIAVSADALPETRANARAAGMQDYLVKPYTEEQLLEILRKYLSA
ncbi:MAG TPA: response regulator, partial [Gammaproteobacteria bacterium]